MGERTTTTPPAPPVPSSVDHVTTPLPVDAPGLDPASANWQRVSPKYVLVDLVASVLGMLIPLVATGIVALVLGSELPWLWALPAVFLGITIILCALTPRRVQSIGYLLRDDDLIFRRGILFQRMVAVPYGRMQLIDITRGPLTRAAGLAELKLVTAAAATAVVIPGLPLAEAERLRDHLVEVAESRRAGL